MVRIKAMAAPILHLCPMGAISNCLRLFVKAFKKRRDYIHLMNVAGAPLTRERHLQPFCMSCDHMNVLQDTSSSKAAKG